MLQSVHETGELDGAGGLRIYTQSWLPDADPSAVLVLAHGAGEHSGRYAHVAARFTSEGLALHALDHRGHGHSEGRRAYVDRTANLVADLDQVVVRARERHPSVPLFLLGHSMGGWLAIAYTLEHQERLDGLLLSAPLAPNINHRDTVFGGSAAALATLAAWSLVHTRLLTAGKPSRLVIQRNTMSYEQPISGDFMARAFISGPESWQSFMRLLERKGKARITASSELLFDGQVVGRFEGDFVALSVS